GGNKNDHEQPKAVSFIQSGHGMPCPYTQRVAAEYMIPKRTRLRIQRLRTVVVSLVLLSLTLSHASCFLDESLDQYYGRIVVPRSQEFNWSDGGLPQTFD